MGVRTKTHMWTGKWVGGASGKLPEKNVRMFVFKCSEFNGMFERMLDEMCERRFNQAYESGMKSSMRWI